MNERLELLAERGEHKKRLDDFLFDRLTDLSRMYIREIVCSGDCEVNGRFENVGYRLRVNDFVEISVDRTRGAAMCPQKIELDIIFEDAHLIVVNKPPGMLVHPTHRDRSGTLLNGLTFYLNPPEKNARFIRPGLVHRLDKQTSGLIVAAKTAQAHRVLSDHFKRRLVKKLYTTLVDGNPAHSSGVISIPIGRFDEEKRWGAKVNGKAAETRYVVKRLFAKSALLELEPITGRTNQLRIHCASIGNPIVGDTARGGSGFGRLCLHASTLAFNHPVSGDKMKFTAPVTNEFGKVID